jgi:nitrite reductase/ring-hydroxylating ferredoxin subunit
MGRAADFPDGVKIKRKVNEKPILILHRNGRWYAFEEKCPHMSRSMIPARVRDHAIECIWHNMAFDLATGKILDHSGFMDIPALTVYDVKIENGRVYVYV